MITSFADVLFLFLCRSFVTSLTCCSFAEPGSAVFEGSCWPFMAALDVCQVAALIPASNRSSPTHHCAQPTGLPKSTGNRHPQTLWRLHLTRASNEWPEPPRAVGKLGEHVWRLLSAGVWVWGCSSIPRHRSISILISSNHSIPIWIPLFCMVSPLFLFSFSFKIGISLLKYISIRTQSFQIQHTSTYAPQPPSRAVALPQSSTRQVIDLSHTHLLLPVTRDDKLEADWSKARSKQLKGLYPVSS
jgi:hypothetical protein